jgi:uncharacterized membrane protein YciS (DUF1049 family)
MSFFFTIKDFYLPKFWPFLLNHPVYISYSNISISKTAQNQTPVIMNILLTIKGFHLPKCWPFFLNHPVYIYYSNSSISKPAQNQTPVHMNIFLAIKNFHLPKFLPFLLNHPVYIYYSNSSISKTAQNQTPVLMNILLTIKDFYFPKYLPFLLIHPVYTYFARLTSDNLLPLLVKLVRSYCCLPLFIGSYFIFDCRKPLATPLPLYWLTEHLLHCSCHSVCSRDSPESWQMQILRQYEGLILSITWQYSSCLTRHDSRHNVW